MSSEQPSLFDQLTPSDSLRDDLAWIDSLQEDTQEDDKPARQERKPRKRRGRKNIPTEHEPEQPTPPPPPAKPGHEPEQPMLIVPDMTQTDEPIPPAGLEAPTTVIEPPDPETPDESPAETTVIGPEPKSETTILPEEALEDVADPDSPSGDSKAMTWVKRGLIIAGAAIMLLIILALAGSHSTAVKEKTAYERVQASMSQLAACNGKAKTTVGNADKAGVAIRTWTRYVTSSHRTANSSGPNAPACPSASPNGSPPRPTRPRNEPAHWPARSTGSSKPSR